MLDRIRACCLCEFVGGVSPAWGRRVRFRLLIVVRCTLLIPTPLVDKKPDVFNKKNLAGTHLYLMCNPAPGGSLSRLPATAIRFQLATFSRFTDADSITVAKLCNTVCAGVPLGLP